MTATVGEQAPDFSLRSQHGETITRDDLAGAPALVVFFPFAFSGICSSELADLRDHRDRFDAAGVRLIAISCDPMYALRVFADQDELGFTMLSDFWPHGEVSRAFGCFEESMGAPLRGSFGLDADAIVRSRVVRGPGERREIDLHLAAAEELSTQFR
jgi:peroxiredoxin